MDSRFGRMNIGFCEPSNEPVIDFQRHLHQCKGALLQVIQRGQMFMEFAVDLYTRQRHTAKRR